VSARNKACPGVTRQGEAGPPSHLTASALRTTPGEANFGGAGLPRRSLSRAKAGSPHGAIPINRASLTSSTKQSRLALKSERLFCTILYARQLVKNQLGRTKTCQPVPPCCRRAPPKTQLDMTLAAQSSPDSRSTRQSQPTQE
jgi:hypothetical protein